MKKISKIKTIKDAFVESLPVDEQWYQDRLAICNSCEYNSANTDRSLLEKVKDLAGASCTACGCFIERKCSRKEEECGLVEKGLEPKWNRLAIKTAEATAFNIYNNSPEKINIDLSEDGTHYVLDYGTIDKQYNTNVQVLLEGDNQILKASAGCSCTTPTINYLSNELTELNLGLNLQKISGKFSKTVTLRCRDKQNIVIKLKGEVNG